MIRGVAFHFDTLNIPQHHPKRTELEALLRFLQSQEVKTAVLTTSRVNANTKLTTLGLPRVDHEITRGDVGIGKGSPLWIQKTCELMNVKPHELLYIGGGVQDWRTAINTPVFYIQGQWGSPMEAGVTALNTASPHEVITLIELFFNRLPTYAYWSDGARTPTHIRCMLPHDATLLGDKGKFSLQRILTYDEDHSVHGNDARHVLMFSLLASLYSEGLLERDGEEKPPVFTIFPSSNPATTDSHFDEFMRLVAKSFHGTYVPDLLQRHTPALDTSLERYRARQEDRPPNVGVLTHANTVRLNPARKSRLEHRLIVVLDDFCNTGLSLDWARVLLWQAGIKRLVLASVGKYNGTRYDFCKLRQGLTLNPFAQTTYTQNDFTQQQVQLSHSPEALPAMQAVFEALLQGTPYPVTDL